jgi:hypothetical protein
VTNQIKSTEDNSLPEYLRGWKTEAETLAEFRQLRPRLHKTTLGRMRRKNEIEAIKFGGEWFYKPESVFSPKSPLRNFTRAL